ncbi:CPBP family intramembrane glutamic endopeptidase [Niabella beijingensis]|uniref:CPBP family intramembrane glutamic endopeptidase n=1 Tax=Niabella beijingensis TaxID=2872700 RepID=UPI001CBA9AB8|nr:type II CAAX endopeptidase family protein [Niabella beijingensis]MBZ4191645.1 CPBP family intramembrane metalloprotease [Niabella beijingensis]
MSTPKGLQPWLTVMMYFLVLSIATVIAKFVPVLDNLFFYFCVSFLSSLWILRKQKLAITTIGFIPTRKRDWKNFFIGSGIGLLMFIVTSLLIIWFAKEQWHLNKQISVINLVITLIMVLWSAFVQEFVFRGYPFQELLKNYRPWVAQIAIAIPFGLMHINSSMTPLEMGKVMLTTGMGSLLFGLGYIKTKKLLFPIGLHFGWNYAQALVSRTGDNAFTLFNVTQSNMEHYSFYNTTFLYLVVITITMVVIARYKREDV